MSNYWQRRQAEDMHRYIGQAEDTADQISKLYLKASRYLSLQADQIFEKYKTRYGLSDADAKRLLDTMRDKTSLDELLNRLRSGDKTESRQELLKQLEAPAYQARLERLRRLQEQLNSLMENVYRQELELSTSLYTQLAKEAYYRSIYNIQQRAGAASPFAHISKKQVDRVVKSRWSGENYSSRIWGNTQKLAQSLKEELLVNLVTGRTNREAAAAIAQKFAQGSSMARRLVWTEGSYLANEMNYEAYEECGIGRYQYLATLDLKTCTRCCRQLDGKIFRLKDRKVGVNYPPMHPWCRCTTVSVVDESLIERMKRAARDPKTGKSILVPRSMTYEQWYEKYVENRGRESIENQGGPGIMRLPRYQEAVIPKAKFVEYALNPEKDLDKAKAFQLALGYTKENADELIQQIYSSLSKYSAKEKPDNGWGKRYEVKMDLTGPNGKTAKVITAWIDDKDTGEMRLTSAYVDKG